MTRRGASGPPRRIRTRRSTGRAIRGAFRAAAVLAVRRLPVPLARFRRASAALLARLPSRPVRVLPAPPPKSYTVPVRVGPSRPSGPMSRGELYEYYKRIGRLEMFFALFGE